MNIPFFQWCAHGFNLALDALLDGRKHHPTIGSVETALHALLLNEIAELIRPILRGKDIKRYGYEWADLWLIYIPWHFPYHFDASIQGASDKAEKAFKKQYPAVYSHMLQYKEPLSKRNKAETGIRYEWYAMQRWGAKYWEDFS